VKEPINPPSNCVFGRCSRWRQHGAVAAVCVPSLGPRHGPHFGLGCPDKIASSPPAPRITGKEIEGKCPQECISSAKTTRASMWNGDRPRTLRSASMCATSRLERRSSRFTVKNEVAPGNPVAPLVWHRELHAENPAIAERIDGGMPPSERPPWRAAVRGFPPYALLLFCSLPHPSPGVIP